MPSACVVNRSLENGTVLVHTHFKHMIDTSPCNALPERRVRMSEGIVGSILNFISHFFLVYKRYHEYSSPPNTRHNLTATQRCAFQLISCSVKFTFNCVERFHLGNIVLNHPAFERGRGLLS